MSIKFKNVEVFEGPRYITDFDGNDYGEPIFELVGKNGKDEDALIGFDDDMLSKHLLILGGIGMGKTNTFKGIVKQTSDTLDKKGVMLIFDTKGDFYSTFGNQGKDYLISNTYARSAKGKIVHPDKKDIWNIFSELDEEKLNETSNEIASMIFASHIEKSSQPFFPRSAKYIFAAVLRALYRLHYSPKYISKGLVKLKSAPSNLTLKKFFNGENIFLEDEEAADEEYSANVVGSIFALLNYVSEERGALSYISMPQDEGSPIDGQTLGIIAELRGVIDDIFIGNFGKEGEFSIRKAINERGGKRIFLEYDMVEGAVLSPIYSLLVDMAIKESLAPKNNYESFNTYFIVDEFKLLPGLKHMDDAINFGRSLGVKFVIGVQNISQIIENYGEEGAMNILSGFLNVFAFKVSDHATRKYLVELFGENVKRTAYLSAVQSRGVTETLEKGNVVEDWDLQRLQKYELIARLSSQDNEYSSPFIFKTLLFK